MTDSTLRRHNSIATTVALPLPYRTTSLDMELVSLTIKPPFSPSSSSYTSLRDVLPSPHAAVNSPTASSATIINDISIRNRLVKHAAWAYLQPMSASPSASSAPHFFRRLSFLYRRIVSSFARFFRRILHALRGQEVSTS